MVVFDPEARRFIDSNQAAAKIFGYSSPEEVVGKTPLDMAAPTQYDGSDSATASDRRDQSALVQGIESFEWRPRDRTEKSGTASILMIYVSPVRENSMKESHQPED